MARSILKIHTQNGDIPIGYPGLADKPIADKTLSEEGAFADSKAVGDKFKEVKTETDSLKGDLDDEQKWLGYQKNVFDGRKFICPDTSNWSVITAKDNVIITHKTKWQGTIPTYPLNLAEGKYIFNADYTNSIIKLKLYKDGTALFELTNGKEFSILSDSNYEIIPGFKNEEGVYTITNISIINPNTNGIITNMNRAIEKIENTFIFGSKKTETPAIISFIDDDCRSEVYRDLFPIIKQLNIPYTLACPIGEINTNSKFMTLSQLNEMVDYGITLSCHGYKEVNMNTVSSDELNAILKKCKKQYKEYGFDVDTYAYCQGIYTDDNIRKCVKKNFKAGFLTKWGVNYAPFESFYLKRYGFLSDENFDLSDAKAMVDYVAQNGGWLIFMTHAWFDYFQQHANEDFPSLVNYIRSKNVDIVDINKVINDYGNDLECGIFKKSEADLKKYMVVDYKGNTWLSKANIYSANAPDDIENLETNDGIIVCGLLNNKSLDSSGNIFELNDNYNFYISKPINVSNCSSVQISGCSYYGRAIYAFYDENGVVVGMEKGEASPTVITKKIVNVPTSAKTLVISGHENVKIPYAKKIYN